MLRGLAVLIAGIAVIVVVLYGFLLVVGASLVYLFQLVLTHTIQPDETLNKSSLLGGLVAVGALTIFTYFSYRRKYGSQWLLFEIHTALDLLLILLSSVGLFIGFAGVLVSGLSILMLSDATQYIPLLFWAGVALGSFLLYKNLDRLRLPFEPPKTSP
jgi:hypothetical protein